jgi:hypothetical protein
MINYKIILISFIFIISCASNGVERRPSRPRNFISQEELKEIPSALTAADIISIARPGWLRGKGLTISVYLNGVQMGGIEQLDNIPSLSIKELKWLSPSESAILYGW